MEAKDTVLSPEELAAIVSRVDYHIDPDDPEDEGHDDDWSDEIATYGEDQLMAVAKAQDKVSTRATMQKVVDSLGLHENELGFCEISNHAPYESLLKENGLEEVGADGVDTMSDGSIYKMIMDSETEQ